MLECFGVQFKSLRSLLRCLGYSAVMSTNSVNKNYGSIDQLIIKRLGTNDPVTLSTMLKELKLKDKGAAVIGDKLSASVDPVCIAVMRAIYQQIDQDKRSTIINTIAGLNSIDATELTNKIENFLK